MIRTLLAMIFVTFSGLCVSQNTVSADYAVSKKQPYGTKNPTAAEQLNDFQPMIGKSQCKSLRRNPDQSWQDTTTMLWSFKYILNGTAIQDETWYENFYATSIRQFHADSNIWVVSYSSYPGVSTKIPVWKGNKTGDDIVLEQKQKSPNGMEGASRLTFTDISSNGFHWKGEWVSEDQSIVYPFWEIWCTKIDQ